MSDITPHTIADRLQQLAAEMLDIAAEMDYFGGFSQIGKHGKELAAAAMCVQSWADGIRENYPSDPDAATEQPTDRAPLQAAGIHPEPCARHCEANAYQIEIRRISAALAGIAKGEVLHSYNGLCPDSINGPRSRDPDCPACRVLSAAEGPQNNPRPNGD